MKERAIFESRRRGVVFGRYVTDKLREAAAEEAKRIDAPTESPQDTAHD